MKLKERPEDFQVEELTNVAPEQGGDFSFYRLEKEGWTTLDALQAIGRRWYIEGRRLSYGGLKDRHGKTNQYLTIYKGPERDLEHHTVSLTYLGHVAEPYRSQAIRAN